MKENIERYFIGIILLYTIIAYFYPSLFIPYQPFIPVGLGFIMFGIGINTPFISLTNTLSKTHKIAGLVGLRYLFMPLCACLLVYLFHLNEIQTIGLLVLSAAPGGTAANVMAYLAKSNVALAVLLTFGSTLVSPFLTPAIIYLTLHQQISIHFWSMVLHIATIVLIPIFAGLLFNRYQSPIINKLKNVMPTLSIFMIGFLIACIVALNQQALQLCSNKFIMAIICLNLMGYLIGYCTARFLQWDYPSQLATAFDYGMFDAAVAMVICLTFFDKETAIPAVLISFLQNVTAPILIRLSKSTYILRTKLN